MEPNKSTPRTVCLAALVSLVLSACSSSSSNNTSNNTLTGPLTKLGTVNAYTSIGPDTSPQVDLEISFFGFESDFTELYQQQIDNNADNCEIDNSVSNPALQALFESSTALNAGDALVLSSPAGTLATITADPNDLAIEYLSDNTLTSLPDDLTIDIPGAEFPAFANASIPNSISINDFDFPVDDLTESSVYTWTPTGVAGAVIQIGISNEFSDETVIIDCNLVDDGSFQLPADIVAQVGNFSNGFIFNATVGTFTVMQSGDSALQLVHTTDIALPAAAPVGG